MVLFFHSPSLSEVTSQDFLEMMAFTVSPRNQAENRQPECREKNEALNTKFETLGDPLKIKVLHCDIFCFLKIHFIPYAWCFIWMYVHHVHPQRSESALYPRGTGVTDDCELLCGCRGLNQGSLQEYQVFSISELSLQPSVWDFCSVSPGELIISF